MTTPTNQKPVMRFGCGVQTAAGFSTFAIVQDDNLAAIQVAESDDENGDSHTNAHFYLTPKSARTIAAALNTWATEQETPELAEALKRMRTP